MLIAQLSDTHIKAPGELAYGQVDTAAALRAAVHHVNRLSPQPDVLLITGDLVDQGRPAEYAHLRELLAPLEMRVCLVPGNHDSRRALLAAFPDHTYLPRDGRYLHYTIEDFPVRLIGLDTMIPGRPEGMICPERLSWLSKKLAEQPKKPTLLFMHHPPFATGIAHMDAMGCGGDAVLGAVIDQSPQVLGIVCGHVHRAIELLWHRILVSIAPSPAYAVTLDVAPDAPPTFQLEPPACRYMVWDHRVGLVHHLSPIGDFPGPFSFSDAMAEPAGAR